MASEIKVDTISEKTSANGVTIDGVSLKDSKIATANSVDSDAYVDGSIDAVHLSANSVDSDAYVDGSIDTAHIDALQVTGAKLNTDVISAQTELAAEPASADEFMVSDGGVLKRVDFSHMSNTPAFRVKMTASQSITSDTLTLTAFDSTTFDTDSGWTGASTYKWTVPAGKAGKYLISVKLGSYTASNDMTGFQMELYKNGARHIMQILALYTDQSLRHCPGSFTTLEDLSDDDYLQVYCKIIATSPYIKGNEENAYFEGYRIIGA